MIAGPQNIIVIMSIGIQIRAKKSKGGKIIKNHFNFLLLSLFSISTVTAPTSQA